MEARMRLDDAAWEVSDRVADGWIDRIFHPILFNEIGQFLLEHHRACDAVCLTPLPTGAFNVALRMSFERSRAAIIRFPLPGAIMFPEEKVRNEVATMRCLADKTTIPVPFILHSGPRTESPSHIGPFIIMDYIEHHANMIDILKPRDARRQNG